MKKLVRCARCPLCVFTRKPGVFAGVEGRKLLGPVVAEQERKWLTPKVWIGPSILAGALLVELLVVLSRTPGGAAIGHTSVEAKAVGISLFGPYLLAVELASMLLLGALVAAYHLGRSDVKDGIGE